MNLKRMVEKMSWHVIPRKEVDKIARETADYFSFVSDEDMDKIRIAVEASYPRVMLSGNRSFTLLYYTDKEPKVYISPLVGYAPSGHFTIRKIMQKED